MATNNPIATGLEIGKGEAQVFDTSGLAKMAVGRQQMLAQKALDEKKKKENELLDSIVELDTSKLWSRDLDMYTEKWGNYRQFVKDNYKELQNPSKNVGIHQQKKKLEQEMLQFVNSSAEAKKVSYEVEKYLAQNPNKLRDKYNQFSSFKETAGNFDNPFSYLSAIPKSMSSIIEDFQGTATKAYDVDSIYEKDGVKFLRKGSSPEKWKNAYSSYYDGDMNVQESVEEAYNNAGGSATGFDNAKDYYLNEAEKYRPKIKTSRTEKVGSNFNWSIGSGNRHTFGDAVFSSDYVNRDITPDPNDTSKIKAIGDRRINLSLNKKNLPYQEINLQDNLGGAEKTVRVAIQDIVEKGGRGSGNYVLRVRKPKETTKVNKELQSTIENEIVGLQMQLDGAKKKEKPAIQAKIAEKQEELRGLVTPTSSEDYDVVEYPLTETTNIGVLENALGGVKDLYDKLPELLTKVEGGKGNKPPAY